MDIKFFPSTCKKCGKVSLVTFWAEITTEDIGEILKWKCKFCKTINDIAITEMTRTGE